MRSPAASDEELRLGNVSVNFATYSVTVSDSPIDVTYHEFELLRALCSEAGRIVHFDALCNAIWGASGPRERRRLSVTVFRLRLKLAGSSPYKVEMVRGRGYGFIAPRFGREAANTGERSP